MPKLQKYVSGYRPRSLGELGRLTDDDIRRQEGAYVAWLAKQYGTTKKLAEAFARSQSSAGLLSATVDRDSNARAEDWLSESCAIRTVRCYSTGNQRHYGWQLPGHSTKEQLDWHKLPSRSDAPTTYVVVLNGRCVNSFLTKSAAKRWALAQLAA